MLDPDSDWLFVSFPNGFIFVSSCSMSKLPDSIDVGDFSMDNMTGTVRASVCSSRVPLPRFPTLECCDFESVRILYYYFLLNKQSQSMCRATALYNQLIY